MACTWKLELGNEEKIAKVGLSFEFMPSSSPARISGRHMASLKEFIDFTLLKKHRLESVKMISLGDSIASAKALYGAPCEKKPNEDFADAIQYTFFAGPFHDAIITEWENRIQSITYWSVRADPARDLRCMLESYGEGEGWNVMEEGYWYQRRDGKVRLWCSAIPAIGIAYVDYLSTVALHKRSKGNINE